MLERVCLQCGGRRLGGAGLVWALVVLWACGVVPGGLLGGFGAGPVYGQVVSEEITFDLSRFGVGGLARQGDWCGFEVVFQDRSESPREVIVEASFDDPDGDRVSYRRAVTSNPGLDQRVWLYGRLPYGFGSTSSMTLSVYEAGEALSDRERERTGLAFSLGRAIASGRFTPEGKGRVQRYASSGLVIGAAPAGIRGYAERDPRLQGEYRAGGHELIEFGMDLAPGDLPDRWVGLSGFETIVWTDADPTTLTPERAEAVRAWVERGGHLVVCLPANSQVWTGGSLALGNPLAGVLPDVEMARLEEPDLESIRGLMTGDPAVQMPGGVSAFRMEIGAGASGRDAVPVLAWPDGGLLASRRLLGTGMVTVVGLDMTSRRLRDRGLPETERFWHRLLGQRGRVYRGTFPDQIRTREVAVMDQVITDEINFEGSAARGVLIGVVVFALYWVVAGPGGFGLLKKFGKVQHAWLAFAGSCVVFTGVAWGVAGLLKESSVSVKHLSVLDVVDGSGEQRSRTWASVLVPWYGDVTFGVSKGEGVDPGESGRDGAAVLSVWGPPVGFGSGSGSFPDNQAYGVSGRVADRLTTPARSTVKQLQADYAGELLWSTPSAVGVDGGRGRLSLDRQGRPVGLLRHNMPGAMTRIQVAVVRNQRRIGMDLSNAAVSNGFVWKLPARYEWEPGSVLDLEAMTRPGDDARTNSLIDASFERFVADIAKRLSPTLPGQVVRGGMSAMLDSLFVHQLEPPSPESGNTVTRYAAREATHGLGLSPWFTEPCIIVTGLVETEGDGIPTPLRVMRGSNWRDLEGTGQTVVRWVYPLPADPPGYLASSGTTSGEPAVETGDTPDTDEGSDGDPGADSGVGIGGAQ